MYISISLLILSALIYFSIYYFREQLSNALNVVDIPDENRKIHKHPTPKTGSFSLAIIILITLILNIFFNIFENSYNLVLVGSLIIFLVGLADDKYNLSALKKTLFITIVTIFLCLYSENLIVSKFYLFHFDFFFKLHKFSIFFTVLCILALVNSLNLADGINGLAIGIIFFWLIYISKIYEHNLGILLYLILFNLILSFYHNIKGHHFLGDSGSLMLSSLIAFLIIMLHNKNIINPNHQNSAESILILFMVPILDMVRLFFQRILRKGSPIVPDNHHLHHLLTRNFSNSKSLLIYFLLINIPILISLNTLISKYYIIAGIIFIYILIIFYYKNKTKY